MILRNKGMEVAYVERLSEAVTILHSFDPTVIFLDNHLPDGRGIEFANYIKAKLPDSTIFIITAKETSVEEAHRNGASEVIFKPFSSEEIDSVIARYA
jgi:two-component system response regulator CitB